MTLDPRTLGWQMDEPVALAFVPGTPAGMGDDLVRWRLEVTGRPSSWAAALAARERAVAGAAARLDEAAGRLAAFVSAPPAVSFAIGAAPPTPEADLALLLAAPAGAVGLAFGPLDDVRERWHAAVDGLRDALDRMGRFVRSRAVVETVIEGVTVARTGIDLDGDLRSVWRRGITETVAALHTRSLELAFAGRRQVMRDLRLLAVGAALVATLPALAANPAGWLVALPAIWRFIDQVTADAAPA